MMIKYPSLWYNSSRATNIHSSNLNRFSYSTASNTTDLKPVTNEQPITRKELNTKYGPISFFVPHPTETPASFVVPVYSFKKARQIDNINLPHQLFGCPIRKDILHRVVIWHLACKRQGTAKTKSRAEIAGSNRKLARQKGLGIARVGSKKSPIRRGGGVAHGKKPRDWSYTLPRKIRQFGLRCALSAKFAQNKLFIVDQMDLDTPRTKPLAILLKRYKWNCAIMSELKKSSNLDFAQRNIPNIEYVEPNFLSVYGILRHKYLVLHRNTIPYLLKRCGISSILSQQPESQNSSKSEEL